MEANDSEPSAGGGNGRYPKRQRRRIIPQYTEVEDNDDDDDDDVVVVKTTNTRTKTENKSKIYSVSKEEYSLRQVAAEATVIEFDSDTGRPITQYPFLPPQHDLYFPVKGIIKKKLSAEIISKLTKIHQYIQYNTKSKVPWAGIGDGDTKERAFGFMGNQAYQRLASHGVKLHAAEKHGQDAIDDEIANQQAICIFDIDEEGNEIKQDSEERTIDIIQTTKELIDEINPTKAGVDPQILSCEELIAYQINLHNGSRYLPAHLDWPLHEGFGQMIMTIAMKGNASVLLIGGDTVLVGSEEIQPAWRFYLQQGECYIMSDNARNRCLHAVVADSKNADRESLNLRFGLHTPQQAKEQIIQYWTDELK